MCTCNATIPRAVTHLCSSLHPSPYPFRTCHPPSLQGLNNIYEMFLTAEMIEPGGEELVNNGFITMVFDELEEKSSVFKKPANMGHFDSIMEYVGVHPQTGNPSMFKPYADRAGPANQYDELVLLALKFYPTEDSELLKKLCNILLKQELTVENCLQLLSHDTINLLPASLFRDETTMIKTLREEASSLVVGIPGVVLKQELAGASDQARPMVKHVMDSVATIAKWTFSSRRTMDSLQNMILTLQGDALPKKVMQHMTMPLLELLNGDKSIVKKVRMPVAEGIKQRLIKSQVKEMAIKMGVYAYGCSETIATRVVNVVEDSQNFDTRLTHLSKLQSLQNESYLRSMSSFTTITLAHAQGINRKLSGYVMTAVMAIYRARWLSDRTNFEDFVLLPDAGERCQGTLIARGMVYILEAQQLVSPGHATAMREIIFFVGQCHDWEKIGKDSTDEFIQEGRKLERSPEGRYAHSYQGKQIYDPNSPLEIERRIPSKFRFYWHFDPQAQETKELVDPVLIASMIEAVFDALNELCFPRMNEWNRKKRKWAEVSGDLSKDKDDYKLLATMVKNQMYSADQIELRDPTGIGKCVKKICAIDKKLETVEKPLRDLIKEIIACIPGKALMAKLLVAISEIPQVVLGKLQLAATSEQIDDIIGAIFAKTGKWGMQAGDVTFGTVTELVGFIMMPTKTTDISLQAREAFKDEGGGFARTVTKRLKRSLEVALHGEHTGVHYSEDIMMPLVRVLHRRHELFEDVVHLPALLPGRYIAAENHYKENERLKEARKNAEDDANSEDGDNAGEDEDDGANKDLEKKMKKLHSKCGEFPAFDMFSWPARAKDDSDLNEIIPARDANHAGYDAMKLIGASKAVLYKAFSTDPDFLKLMSMRLQKVVASTVTEWIAAVMRFHQRMFEAINLSEELFQDVDRLLLIARPSCFGAPDTGELDDLFLRGLWMVFWMSDGSEDPELIDEALVRCVEQIFTDRGCEENIKAFPGRKPTWEDYFWLEKRQKSVMVGGASQRGEWRTLHTTVGEPLANIVGDKAISEMSDGSIRGKAEKRCKVQMLCFLLRHLWLQSKEQVEDWQKKYEETRGKEEAFSLLVKTLHRKIEKIIIIYGCFVDEADIGAVGIHFDKPHEMDAGQVAYKYWAVMYHRTILTYVWWHCSMRKHKLSYMQNMIYRMPKDERESDQDRPFPQIDEATVLNGCHRLKTTSYYHGQMGILQYAARTAHFVFNLPYSRLQRGIVSLPKIVTKLMEFQRGFEVDLTLDRNMRDPEHIIVTHAARIAKADNFAIDILSCNEILEPYVNAIRLNQRMLREGVDCPRDLENEVIRIAHDQIVPYLEYFPLVDDALTPPVRGRIKARSGDWDDDSASLSEWESESMFDSVSLFDADASSVGGRSRMSKSSDTRSVGSGGSKTSKGSRASKASRRSARSSSRQETTFDDDPAMLFIPFCVHLYTACADVCCDVSSWFFFEKELRAMVSAAVFTKCGGTPESPFVFLDIDDRLRKIVECTMSMAMSEEKGESSRDAALSLAAYQGQVLGLDTRLVDGMLAVVDKNPQSRLNALSKMGGFLAQANTGTESTLGGGASSLSATISGLVALATGDLEGGRSMALKLGGFDVRVMGRVSQFISALHRAGLQGDIIAERRAYDPLSQLKGDITEDKIFDAFDKDKSGMMSYDEYSVINKYLTFPNRLSTGTIVRIFKRADRKNTDTLTVIEFKATFAIFSHEISERVLDRRGLSHGQLAKNLTREFIALAFLATFVISGAEAFSTPGNFEATVNSAVQVLAGVGVYGASQSEDPNETETVELEDEVEKTLLSMSNPS